MKLETFINFSSQAPLIIVINNLLYYNCLLKAFFGHLYGHIIEDEEAGVQNRPLSRLSTVACKRSYVQFSAELYGRSTSCLKFLINLLWEARLILQVGLTFLVIVFCNFHVNFRIAKCRLSNLRKGQCHVTNIFFPCR